MATDLQKQRNMSCSLTNEIREIKYNDGVLQSSECINFQTMRKGILQVVTEAGFIYRDRIRCFKNLGGKIYSNSCTYTCLVYMLGCCTMPERFAKF
jgi:hypothetical protein